MSIFNRKELFCFKGNKLRAKEVDVLFEDVGEHAGYVNTAGIINLIPNHEFHFREQNRAIILNYL